MDGASGEHMGRWPQPFRVISLSLRAAAHAAGYVQSTSVKDDGEPGDLQLDHVFRSEYIQAPPQAEGLENGNTRG